MFDENNVFNVVGMCCLVEVIVVLKKEWVVIDVEVDVVVCCVVMEVECEKF